MDLCRTRDRYSLKMRSAGDDSIVRKPWFSLIDKNSNNSSGGGAVSSPLSMSGGVSSANQKIKKMDGWGLQRKDSVSGLDSQRANQSGRAVVRKKRVHVQVSDLFLFMAIIIMGF